MFHSLDHGTYGLAHWVQSHIQAQILAHQACLEHFRSQDRTHQPDDLVVVEVEVVILVVEVIVLVVVDQVVGEVAVIVVVAVELQI